MEWNGERGENGGQRVAELDRDPEAVSIATIGDLVESGDATNTYALAQVLDKKVAADPSVATRVRDRIEPLLDHETKSVQRFAAIVFEQLAGRAPESVVPVADVLIEKADSDDVFARRHIVWALAHVSTYDPDALTSGIQQLVPGEGAPPYFDREHVLMILDNVSAVDPEATLPMLPALFEVLAVSDDYVGAKKDDASVGSTNHLSWLDQFKPAIDPPLIAANVVLAVSQDSPESIVAHIEDVTTLLEEVERVTIRRELVEILATVAHEQPEAVTSAIPQLASQLDSRDEVLQARSARALGLIHSAATAEVTAAVVDSLPSLEPLLYSAIPNARVAVASLLSCVADEDPDAIKPFESGLIACLESDEPAVVASAAMALAAVGTEDARRALGAAIDRDLESPAEETVQHALDSLESQ